MRQREYLESIKKYMHRFSLALAETDVQRHFLVSAPSVNQMMRTLERRGFITRQKDRFGQTLPRSIRVLWDG
jgi:repressor LexA